MVIKTGKYAIFLKTISTENSFEIKYIPRDWKDHMVNEMITDLKC